MGMIARILGGNAHHLGNAAVNVSEVFVANKTKRQEGEHREHITAQGQFGLEFQQAPSGFFDRFVNALNRLPRPILALGTVGLFIYAMVNPSSFSQRMTGLDTIPEQLWWLLGAIVSFYFGARELHHFRQPKRNQHSSSVAETPKPTRPANKNTPPKSESPDRVHIAKRRRKPRGDPAAPDFNAALAEWQDQQNQL